MQNVLLMPILTIFLISGCATTSPLEVFTREVERMPLDIPLPDPVLLDEINLMIVNEANQEEIFAKLKEANIDPVLFAYTDEDYELIQKNNVQLRSQIIKYIKIIEAYKAYYEPEEQEGKNNSIMKSSNFEPKSFDNDKD